MVGKGRRKILLAAALVILPLLAASCQCGNGGTTPTTPATTSPTTAAASTTPAGETTVMARYESAEHGFSFEYPEEWTDSVHGGTTSFYVQYQDSAGDFAVNVALEYGYEPADLAEAVAETKAYLETMSQYELFSEGDVTIGDGIAGYELIGQGDEDVGQLAKFRYIIIVRDNQTFWLGVFADTVQFDEQRNVVDAIIDSFRLSEYTYEPPAPSPGGIYTSSEYGFSITYPEGWSDVTSGEYSEILDLRADAGVPEVMVRTWTGATTAAEGALSLQQMYAGMFEDYELVSEGGITLDDGTPGYQFVFNAIMQGYLLTSKCVLVVRGEEAFYLMGFTPIGSYAQDEAAIDSVIGSFHLE